MFNTQLGMRFCLDASGHITCDDLFPDLYPLPIVTNLFQDVFGIYVIGDHLYHFIIRYCVS